MKILLNGATAGTNFGDFLFAQMFQNVVSEKVGMENTCWYNSKFAYSDFYREHLKNNNSYKLREISGLVYISGGYFCGDDHKLKHYVIRYLSYFSIGLKCLLRKKPYGVFGVEVGKSKNFMINFIQKILLKKARIVIVRNKKSYEQALKYGVKNLICTADTVFAMDEQLYAHTEENAQLMNCNKKLLLLHISAYKEKNKTIKEKIVPIVNRFLQNHLEYGVVISPDQYTPQQDEVLEDVAQCLHCDIIIKNFYEDPLALCKVLGRVDTIVTTKLHVGIVGALLNRAVISFSGHTEKISRLYEELGEQGRTAALAELDLDTGVAMLEKYYDKPICVCEEIKNKAQQNIDRLVSFVEELSGRECVEK